MKRTLFKTDLAGFVFVSVLGTLCHFLFEFFNENKFAALFFPVNESVWEHLKIIYFPFLFYTVIECFISKLKNSFFSAKLIGVLCGMIFMIAFFYTYSGVLGENILIIDILTFLVSVFISFFVSHEILINSIKISEKSETLSVIAFIIICVIFFIFTFSPPFVPVFKDISKGIYGI